jgi:glutaredoxin
MELQEIKSAELQVYTATWCPDCRALDRWLAANGIPHSKVDIETTEGAAEKLERETGKRAIPFILVNGKRWVRGYHKDMPARFSAEALLNDLMEAIKGQAEP